MPQVTPSHRRVTLVIDGDDPMGWFAEFVNCMDEHEERRIIAALHEHLSLFAACREIEAEQVS